MLKILVAALAVIASQYLLDAPAEAAQSAREKCCIQMHGVWRTARDGRALCYSLGRGASDAYYRCVAAKGG